jgi:hypothetical protein
VKNISINLAGYRLTVVEPPVVKLKEDGSPKVDWSGATQFEVALFVRQVPVVGQRTPKGEEIRVTLAAESGEVFEEGDVVELIDPRVSPWEIKEQGRMSSGLSFKALGLKPCESDRSRVSVSVGSSEK